MTVIYTRPLHQRGILNTANRFNLRLGITARSQKFWRASISNPIAAVTAKSRSRTAA